MSSQPRACRRCAVAVALGLPAAALASSATLLTIDFPSGAYESVGHLVLAADGNFYGTASGIGQASVIELTPQGTLSTVYVFSSAAPQNGLQVSGVTPARDGNLYGTTALGGANGAGTVFRLTPAGVLTTLYNLPLACGGPGAETPSTLIEGSDGNFYGTLVAPSCLTATFFRITPTGAYSALATFDSATVGLPLAPLLQASDGNFYGTASTSVSGANNTGTVYRITPTGALSVLTQLPTGATDAAQTSALVEAADANFYGTTAQGGPAGAGAIFRVTPAGTLTVLYTFTGGNDGLAPNGVTVGTDGNLYGTTYGMPFAHPLTATSSPLPAILGTIFQMTPAGTLTTLYRFAGVDGQNPVGPLTLGADGNLYGTTAGFFTFLLPPSGQTIFKVSTGFAVPSAVVAPPPAGVIFTVAGSNSATVSWQPLAAATSYNVYATSPAQFAASGGFSTGGLPVPAASTGNTIVTLTNLPAGTTYFKVAWVNKDGTSGLSDLATQTSGSSGGSGDCSLTFLTLLAGVLGMSRSRRTPPTPST
jgi:uncharacterized repeat protein (TIGR03803 family)